MVTKLRLLRDGAFLQTKEFLDQITIPNENSKIFIDRKPQDTFLKLLVILPGI